MFFNVEETLMNAPLRVRKVANVIHGGNVLDLPELTVPARDDTRRIVPVRYLVTDLEVKVPKSPDLKLGDFIRLFREGLFFGDELELTEPDFSDPAVTEYTLYYPQAEFPADGTDTVVNLDYGIYDPISDNGTPTGLLVAIRFDRRAPAGIRPGPIAFTPDQLSGITESDLAGDVLPVVIGPYFDGAPEDTIEVWLGTADNEASGSYLTPPFPVTDPGLPIPVSFHRDDLRAIGDGQRWFAYRVTDWAGNVSVISSRTPITVFLDVPTLLPPLVPEADDGLVTYNDANPDVGVDIPDYPGAAVADQIVVSWGGTELPAYPLQASDIGNDPLVTILAPYATVALVGGGAVDVSYVMKRAGQPDVPSGPTTVQVNLTTPGGPDPDPNPDLPEHGNIKVPTLKVGISPDNTITPDDFTNSRPGQITIHRGGVDNNPIWLVDDVIQVYLNETTDDTPALPPLTVTVANEPGDITVAVPFTGVIENLPSGVVDMFFTLTRMLPATPNSVPVTVRSPIQPVTVSAGGDLPGGGNPLDEAGFPEVEAATPFRNILTRPMGIDGTTFRINLSGVSNIELGKEPKLSYNFVGIEHQLPARPVYPIAPPPQPYTPIEASRIKVDDIPLTQDDLDRGYYEVTLTYAQLYPVCRNGATLDYTLKNNLGETSATQRYVYVALNLGGQTCSLP
ncbi:hypothetical protein [Pseudomonas sp. NPDC089401]|uniref:hypothetical protein n=1 Tax=Pseudomonas sp. NPDC089401 TaxID=3364462 RepID=UPI0037F3E347